MVIQRIAKLNSLARSTKGATTIEFAFVAFLISIAAAGILPSIGKTVSGHYARTSGGFDPPAEKGAK
jgi:Flp pilus assembly pilin Flp